MTTSAWPSDWMRAALGLGVLRVLESGPTYGYAIAAALEVSGFGAVKGGTLYPLLTRLEASGLLSTEWKAGDGGPGRKYFSLTAVGLDELARQRGDWRDFTQMVHRHLHDTEGTTP